MHTTIKLHQTRRFFKQYKFHAREPLSPLKTIEGSDPRKSQKKNLREHRNHREPPSGMEKCCPNDTS